jgi:hypothetical protein
MFKILVYFVVVLIVFFVAFFIFISGYRTIKYAATAERQENSKQMELMNFYTVPLEIRSKLSSL